MDDPYGCAGRILVLIVLFVISGIFYGFSAALSELSHSDREEEAKSGTDRRNTRIRKCLDEPRRFTNTVQLIGALNAVVLSLYEVPFFASLAAAHTSAADTGTDFIYFLYVCLFAFCLIVLMLAFTFFASRKIACAKPEKYVRRYVDFIWTVTGFFRPMAYLTTKFSHLIIRLRGIDPLADDSDVTEEEIISMVDEGHEQGVLQDSEAEMIRNIFELNDKDAKDIMTHRKNIVAVDGSMTLEETLPYILEQNFSRFPVFEDDIDTLIGILHIKDAMQCFRQESLHAKRVRDIPQLLRTITYIPETRSIDVLFRDMQREKNHIVVVVDEYGQTSGIVAMEDILEEIVGNIMDEYDVEEDPITKQADGSYVMLGMTPLEDVEDELGIEFEDEDNETLNGFLISKLDRIPSDKEHIEIECLGYRFRVLSVANKTIGRILVTKIPEQHKEQEDL